MSDLHVVGARKDWDILSEIGIGRARTGPMSPLC